MESDPNADVNFESLEKRQDDLVAIALGENAQTFFGIQSSYIQLGHTALVLVILLAAFAVAYLAAGLAEELAKYFGVARYYPTWLLEHREGGVSQESSKQEQTRRRVGCASPAAGWFAGSVPSGDVTDSTRLGEASA